MKPIIVSAPRHLIEGARTSVSATLGVGEEVFQVWYRVSAGSVAEGLDGFLAAALAPAMRVGRHLRFAEPLSPRLLAAVPTIQDIYRSWNPDWQRISIDAPASPVFPRVADRTAAGCFFSGGVDTFYTLLKHRDELDKIIFVHGFDIPLQNEAFRNTVATTIRGIASALGKPLIEIETNLREFSDRYVPWGDFFGAALASVALLLSPQLSRVYIAGSRSYATLHPEGSHPLLDPLWSTEHTEIIHDGCEASRFDKVAAIAQNDLALASLRVCWENRGGAYNCGECEKCLRTMVALRIVGALDRCQTFHRPLNLGKVARIVPPDSEYVVFAKENLRAAEQRGTDPSVTKALRDCVAGRFHRKGWPLVRRARGRLRRLTAQWIRTRKRGDPPQ